MRLFRDKGKARYIFTFSMIPKGSTTRVIYYLIHMSNNLTALEVVKESFWKENTLDYQYYFELYGSGFRTSDYYQENQIDLEFDIKKSSESFCIERLNQDLDQIIADIPDGITFRYLCNFTMEKNPASRKHYVEYLNLKRNENDFQVIRDGKITKSKSIRKDDIVRINRSKQLFLFIK